MQTTYTFPFYLLILFIYLFILQLTLYRLTFLGNDTTMNSTMNSTIYQSLTLDS